MIHLRFIKVGTYVMNALVFIAYFIHFLDLGGSVTGSNIDICEDWVVTLLTLRK